MVTSSAADLIVAWAEEGAEVEAHATATRLHLRAVPLATLKSARPGRPGDTHAPALALVRTPARWELHDLLDRRVRPTAVEFAGPCTGDGSASARGRHLLARAVGLDSDTVIDATAGFGQDAFALAALGYRVIALERCAAMAVLLADALRRAALDPALATCAARIALRPDDAHSVLADLPRADAIYLDPMFPPKRRQATAMRKEMRLLRALAGDDADAVELVAHARRCARRRVVVKRPDDAPPLLADPHMHYVGKLVRYDVYLPLP